MRTIKILPTMVKRPDGTWLGGNSIGFGVGTYPTTIPLENGSMASRGFVYNSKGTSYNRCQMFYRIEPNTEITFDLGESVISGNILYYDADNVFLRRTALPISDGKATLTTPSDARYFKLSMTVSKPIPHITAHSSKELTEVYNPNLVNLGDELSSPSYDSLAFNYPIADGNYTSGRLLLPPNYSLDGAKVPLIVFFHGSNGILTWGANMYKVGTHTYQPYYEYLANEGFAVFDCYPWTIKYDSIGSGAYTTYALPHCKRAYIEGVKYVCSRYNVDIDNVCVIAKSQGGHLAHWFTQQTELPVRAIAMYAPSVSIFKPQSGSLFLQASARQALWDVLGLEGTDEDKDAFVNDGNYRHDAVRAVVQNNLAKFAGLSPALHGVHGGIFEDMLEETMSTTKVKPEWMADLPNWPGDYNYFGIAKINEHREYSKFSPIPVKFWCAFDDINTSTHLNYTIYTWMKNGGSDVQFRVLPDGTGAHYAMDADPNALKTSGTTALGIDYVDMPLAYVETVQFFRNKMAVMG